MSSTRQLAAIMFTDIVGYTAMMQANENKAVSVIKHYNASLEKCVSHFNGQILNYYGDGSLCIFSSATDAVNCSLALQKELKSEPVVPLRIGLHIGEVFFEDAKALGDGVNVASRIQSLGQENTILVSEEVNDKIKNNDSFATTSLGRFDFKNVGKSIEVFALANEGLAVPNKKKMDGKLKKKTVRQAKIISFFALILLVPAAFFIYKKIIQKNDAVRIDKSIAVLPFVDMSPGKDQEYFSDGLSEELLNLLSKIPELKVIGRTSSFSFKGKNEDLRIIGEKLGVANILEGSVQREGNKIRVTTQLIRTSDGFHLWSEKYDRDLQGIFKLQDEIASAVVKELKLKLLTTDTTVSSTTSTDAYNLILQGNYFLEQRGKENLDKALDFYVKALAIDSMSARIWAAIGHCYILQVTWDHIDRTAGMPKARIAANRSVDLDDRLAIGHYVLGLVKMWDFDWPGAEAEYQKVLDLEPGNADALRSKGFLYRCMGRFEEAIQLTKKSITFDPIKPATYFNFGQLLYHTNDHEEGIACYKKALELNPLFPRAHIFLGKIYLLQGKPELALAEVNQERDEAWRTFGLILTYGALGRKKEADDLLSDYINRFSKDNMYQIAEIYAIREDSDKAFAYLEKSYLARESRLTYLKGDPLLKNLESDPRYKAFLKKMRLAID